MAAQNVIVPTRDGSLTLRSRRYGQTFHSENGAVSEALHVYLEGNAIGRTLKSDGQVRVLEVGFGAGLNFMLTAALAKRLGGKLLYTALDEHLPSAQTLEALQYGVTADVPELWESLVRWRGTFNGEIPHGRYALAPAEDCELRLIIGDATKAELPDNHFDAVFLDAFDPKCNPELWTLPFLQRLYKATRNGGRLSTYSAAGAVRRDLTSAGFSVERRVGPPGKRHITVATKLASAS